MPATRPPLFVTMRLRLMVGGFDLRADARRGA
jgi:hypothetical protein